MIDGKYSKDNIVIFQSNIVNIKNKLSAKKILGEFLLWIAFSSILILPFSILKIINLRMTITLYLLFIFILIVGIINHKKIKNGVVSLLVQILNPIYYAFFIFSSIILFDRFEDRSFFYIIFFIYFLVWSILLFPKKIQISFNKFIQNKNIFTPLGLLLVVYSFYGYGRFNISDSLNVFYRPAIGLLCLNLYYLAYIISFNFIEENEISRDEDELDF